MCGQFFKPIPYAMSCTIALRCDQLFGKSATVHKLEWGNKSNSTQTHICGMLLGYNYVQIKQRGTTNKSNYSYIKYV